MDTRKLFFNATIGLSVVFSSIVVYHPTQAISAPVIRFPKIAPKVTPVSSGVTKAVKVVKAVYKVNTYYRKFFTQDGRVGFACQDLYSDGNRSNEYYCR
jgi:hypothetical protein